MRQKSWGYSGKRGQAAVEYVLLVLVVVVFFGIIFQKIRQDLFLLWVCEIGPRVQSPIPCGDRDECFDIIARTIGSSQKIQSQRDQCSNFSQ